MHLSPLGTERATIVFHHGGTESTERNFLFARSPPCGHDPVAGWLYAEGWRYTTEHSPKAEALFPGRRSWPGKKYLSSVLSVSLWLAKVYVEVWYLLYAKVSAQELQE